MLESQEIVLCDVLLPRQMGCLQRQNICRPSYISMQIPATQYQPAERPFFDYDHGRLWKPIVFTLVTDV